MDKTRVKKVAEDNPKLRTKLVPLLKQAKGKTIADIKKWLVAEEIRLAKDFHGAVVARLDALVPDAAPETGRLEGKWDGPKEVFRGTVKGVGWSMDLPEESFLASRAAVTVISLSAGNSKLAYRLEDVDFLDPAGLAEFLAGKLALLLRKAVK